MGGIVVSEDEVLADGSPAVFMFDESNSKRYPDLQRCDVYNDPYSWDQAVKDSYVVFIVSMVTVKI
jgi:hypothetical protein